jgi:hypothetical protein
MASAEVVTEASTIPAHRRADRTADDVRLHPAQRWIMLAVLVTVFLFAGKRPVWHNPFDIDLAIWLSYAPIPILVTLGLAYSRRLSLLTFVLNTTEIALLKFAITYSIATVLWAALPPPPPAEFELRERAARAPEPLPPAVTPWADDERGALDGVVVDHDGDPIAGAFVQISGGLDELVSPRPDTPVVLAPGSDEFAGSLNVVQRWQPLVGRSADKRLHPLRFERDGDTRLTMPVIPEVGDSPIRTTRFDGVLAVRCVLHGTTAYLAISDHGHHAISDGEGRFRLEGVPALDVEVTALLVELPRRAARQTVKLAAGGEQAVRLELPAE